MVGAAPASSPTIAGAIHVLAIVFTTTLQGRYYCSHAADEETGLENTLPQIT